jgi:hypothetical protein
MQNEIEQIVNKYIELLPVEDDKLLAHSEVKASKFLLAVAKLAAIRDQLMNAKVKKDALKSVAYADAINNAVGSNAPTREANAAANPNYLGIAEQVAIIDNQLKYTATMIEVFNNAHILYRGLMKGEI